MQSIMLALGHIRGAIRETAPAWLGPGGYRRAGPHHRGDRPDQVSNILLSAKRKFYAILHQIIAETVEDPADIDAELDELVRVLGAQ